jgi:hypothetical protein
LKKEREQTFQMKKRYYAIPNEHGIWVLWLGPFLAGWGVAAQSSLALLWTFLAILFAFMAHHPLIILVRSLSGLRSRDDVRPSTIWTAQYLTVSAVFALLLALAGQALILLLVLPALVLLVWHLKLVARREERQMPVELVGSGILALAAPAAHIAATGTWTITALWLLLLTWLYSMVSIVYVYLRLRQRQLDDEPDLPDRLVMGRPAMRMAAAALLLVCIGTIMRQLPRFAPLPFLVTQIHVIWGTINPAIGMKPHRVGITQVIATGIFTALLIIAFRASPG